MDAKPPYEVLSGPWSEPNLQPAPHASLDLDPVGVAELVTASSDTVAEQARKVLWHVLPHTALVLVTPGSPTFPVQIAAPNGVRRRLAGLEWLKMVGPQVPVESGVTRLELPAVLFDLHTLGWTAKTAEFGVALIVAEPGRLSVTPRQEQAAMLTAMCVALRRRAVDNPPPPGSLAFSRALSQERERIRLELRSRHATTLSSLLHTLRAATEVGGGQTAPPGVVRAIDIASRALVELQTESDVDTTGSVPLAAAFAEHEEELRPALRAAEIQLAANLDAEDGVRLPYAVVHAARLVTRAAALNAIEGAGADRLRLRWRLTDEALIVNVAHNGLTSADGRLTEIRRVVAELRGRVDLDSHPQWGTTINCGLPLHDFAPAPETATVRRLADLRDREREVLELMIGGLRNREIADRLYISERTVKFHVSNILAKLEVGSRTEAIALAHAAGVSVVAPEVAS
ncbi:MAG TPA: LuxR C-terminal-related transcriptional regulator [Acidimicrobiia bacterium]